MRTRPPTLEGKLVATPTAPMTWQGQTPKAANRFFCANVAFELQLRHRIGDLAIATYRLPCSTRTRAGDAPGSCRRTKPRCRDGLRPFVGGVGHHSERAGVDQRVRRAGLVETESMSIRVAPKPSSKIVMGVEPSRFPSRRRREKCRRIRRTLVVRARLGHVAASQPHSVTLPGPPARWRKGARCCAGCSDCARRHAHHRHVEPGSARCAIQ